MRSIVFLVPLLLTGCSGTLLFNGGLWSHTTEPLTFNPQPTTLDGSARVAQGEIRELSYPMNSFLGVRTGSTGIADVARANGMQTVYYADIERHSALFGLWDTETIHIWGR